MTESGRERGPKLQIQGVHKSFRSRAVLQGIDLDLGEHEVLCLIGPSGCGKSTLLRCIDLLEPIDSGSIALDGVVMTNPRVRMARASAMTSSNTSSTCLKRVSSWAQ